MGLKNGDKKYIMDFMGGLHMDSFHIIDRSWMTGSYPGQWRTCEHCHITSTECPGDGLARGCEENKGYKVDLH